MTRGRGVLAVGSRQLTLGAGSAVLLQPGQDHELLDESQDFELFVLALRPELAAHFRVPSTRRTDCVALDAPTLRALRERLRAVGDVAETSAVERVLGEQFAELASRFEQPSALGRRAVAAIQTDLDVSEVHVADGLRAHPSKVSRAVRDALGMRLVDYRVHLRLMKFIRSVDAGQSLTQAAFASGFGSYAQCHRAFWRHLGCAPKVYFEGTRTSVDERLHASLATSPDHVA